MESFFSAQIIIFILILGGCCVFLSILEVFTKLKTEKSIKLVLKLFGLGLAALLSISALFGPIVFVFQLVKLNDFEEGCLNMALVYSCTVILLSLLLFVPHFKYILLKCTIKKRNAKALEDLDIKFIHLCEQIEAFGGFMFFGYISWKYCVLLF